MVITSESSSYCSVTIIGAGLAGCLLALELRKRSVPVQVFEKKSDPRKAALDTRQSFNVALTERGLSYLPKLIRQKLENLGIELTAMRSHWSDGASEVYPYESPGNHILAISRNALLLCLLDAAESCGARFYFDHECIQVDTYKASARFINLSNDIIATSSTLLVGADGSNSFLRYEMTRRPGSQIDMAQKVMPVVRVECSISASTNKMNGSVEQCLHIWPRDESYLVALPSEEGAAASMFISRTTYDSLGTSQSVADYLTTKLSSTGATVLSVQDQPNTIKDVRVSAFHQGASVLIGNAAHTMAPFYDLDVHCAFEDISVFVELFDSLQNLGRDSTSIAGILAQYTELRKSSSDAIADIALANFSSILMSNELDLRKRMKMEHLLFQLYPQDFQTTYSLVASNRISYSEVLKVAQHYKTTLDNICERFDISTTTGVNLAIKEYIRAVRSPSDCSNKRYAYHDPETLKLTGTQMQNLFNLVTQRITKFHSDVERGIIPPSTVFSADTEKFTAGHEIAAELRELLPPKEGMDDFESLIDTLMKAFSIGTSCCHPTKFSQIPVGGLMQGTVGMLLGRSFNRMPNVWIESPALVQIEVNVIKWFCSMMGYAGDCFGYLTTGGSISNLMGLVCAIRKHRGDYYQNETNLQSTEVVYISEQSHFSNKKAIRIAGYERVNLRVVKIKEDFTMDVDDLRARITADIQAGRSPVCIIATAGTTNTGAIDDLCSIADVAEEHGIWFHCDAAFGGFFNITARGKDHLKGLNRADSITADAHKSLFLPMSLSALLVKDRAHLKDAFQIAPGAVYMPGFSRRDDQPDLCQYGPELTRDFRGLTAYLPLKMHGLDVFATNLNRLIELAAFLHAELCVIDKIECIQKHELFIPVVNFRVKNGGNKSTELNLKLAELICAKGNVFVSATELPGFGTVIRVCTMHHLTEMKHILLLLEDLRKCLDVLWD